MTEKNVPSGKIRIERTYQASIQDVWDMWTTPEGIESWWGPGGFSTKVHKLDLRPGGEMLYSMTAVEPGQIQFMKTAGMPLTTEARLTYSEIVAKQRITYTHAVDFVPGVKPYAVVTLVEFQTEKHRVLMALSLDRMHDEQWTQRSVMGMESQLEKLAKILGSPEGKR